MKAKVRNLELDSSTSMSMVHRPIYMFVPESEQRAQRHWAATALGYCGYFFSFYFGWCQAEPFSEVEFYQKTKQKHWEIFLAFTILMKEINEIIIQIQLQALKSINAPHFSQILNLLVVTMPTRVETFEIRPFISMHFRFRNHFFPFLRSCMIHFHHSYYIVILRTRNVHYIASKLN